MINNTDMITEMVSIWVEEFKNENKNVDDEIDDVIGTIENEKLWGDNFGISCNTMYLEWLKAYKNGDVDD